jgi:hypothetical protein
MCSGEEESARGKDENDVSSGQHHTYAKTGDVATDETEVDYHNTGPDLCAV